MQVTTKITVDLTRRNVGKRVNAVQGDGNTRLVEITLLSGGAPWTPPEGVEAAIAYMQPGGTKGLYNKLADGTAAISISGNVATVILAPQMLVASGTVQASLVFNDAALNRLTTFPFSVCVASNPSAGAQKTEDYIRLKWLEDKLDEYLRKAADSGEFDGKPGDNGVTYTPIVSENGDLSWRNNGGLPNPQTVNIRGPQGDSKEATAAANAAQTSAANAETHAADAAASAAAAQAAVGAMGTELSHIKGDLSDNANADAVTRRSLDALWKLNQGISYQFETDDTEAYQKTVHSGAKLASVETIGGHTESIDGELMSAVVESVVDRGQNLFDKSTAIQGKCITPYGTIISREKFYLSDYISCRDFTDVSINKGGGIVWYGDDGSVLGFVGGKSVPIFRTYTKPSGAVKFQFDIPQSMLDDLSTVMCVAGVYTEQTIPSFTPYKTQTTYTIPSAVRILPGYGCSAGDVYNSIERTDDGWQYVQRVGSRAYQDGDTVTDGVTTYYALINPVITDITELMVDFPANFEVEPGGTLTFENAAKLPVPSSVEYLVSLAEVNG